MKGIKKEIKTGSHSWFWESDTGCEIRTWKHFAVVLRAKPVIHSIKGLGVGAFLGIFCKHGPSQCLYIAFLELEKT